MDRALRSNAMSAIINVRKGADIYGRSPSAFVSSRINFEAGLTGMFSAGEINRARQVITRTAPQIRRLLETAHTRGTIDMDAASQTVSHIMIATADNAGALLGLSRLRNKDEVTFLHSLSVCALMVTFGRALNLGEDTVEILGTGGLLHDLGKMVIPSKILRKNGKLTDREYAAMRAHPERGYAMLSQIEGTPPGELDICLYHHEKYNGTGYPRGLEGEDIPYAARIAAICDVYDALTTVRPYKRAWTQAEAVERMFQAQGHFDPALLKAFVSQLVLTSVC